MERRVNASLRPVAWEREWISDGNVSHRFGRIGDLLVAEWFGVGRLYASRDGSTHQFEVDEEADPDVARRIQRFIAPSPGARHLRGEIALHASAVVIEGHAIAFLGASGAGKSTMAAALCVRPGTQLAADDIVYVSRVDDVPRVVPTERANRLAPSSDAPRRKRAVVPARVAPSPVRLAAIARARRRRGRRAADPSAARRRRSIRRRQSRVHALHLRRRGHEPARFLRHCIAHDRGACILPSPRVELEIDRALGRSDLQRSPNMEP